MKTLHNYFLDVICSGKFIILSADNPVNDSVKTGLDSLKSDVIRLGLESYVIEGNYNGAREESMLIVWPNFDDFTDARNIFRNLAIAYGQESFILGDGGTYHLVDSVTNKAECSNEFCVYKFRPDDNYSCIHGLIFKLCFGGC